MQNECLLAESAEVKENTVLIKGEATASRAREFLKNQFNAAIAVFNTTNLKNVQMLPSLFNTKLASSLVNSRNHESYSATFAFLMHKEYFLN